MLHSSTRRRAATSTRPRRRLALAAGAVAACIASIVPTGAASAASIDVVGGDVNWGFKASFLNYITGPIAKGSYEATGGATPGFNFPGATGTADGDSFSISVNGGVHFRGHDYGQGHLLELSIGNIRIARSGSTGTLTADVTSRALSDEGENGAPGPSNSYSNVVVANLDFGGAGPVVEGGTTTYSNISAKLDSTAVKAFADFYQPGEALDPVTITLVTRAGGDADDPEEGSTTTTTTVESTSTTASTGTTPDGSDTPTDGSGTTPTGGPGGSTDTTVAGQPAPSTGGTPGSSGGVQGGSGQRATALARTGSSPTLAVVGLALLLSGAVVVVSGRRLRSTTV